MIRGLAAGAALGLAVFAACGWAFMKGCPLFDSILERDTILGF